MSNDNHSVQCHKSRCFSFSIHLMTAQKIIIINEQISRRTKRQYKNDGLWTIYHWLWDRKRNRLQFFSVQTFSFLLLLSPRLSLFIFCASKFFRIYLRYDGIRAICCTNRTWTCGEKKDLRHAVKLNKYYPIIYGEWDRVARKKTSYIPLICHFYHNNCHFIDTYLIEIWLPSNRRKHFFFPWYFTFFVCFSVVVVFLLLFCLFVFSSTCDIIYDIFDYILEFMSQRVVDSLPYIPPHKKTHN